MKFKIVEISGRKLMDFTPRTWSVEETVAFVRKNCKPFLQEIGYNKKYMLYRGVVDAPDYLLSFIGETRKDRKPRDTDKDIHKKLDDAFLLAFGWRARSQALFVTNSRTFAAAYTTQKGSVYQIFPIGKFKYLYSPSVKDMYEYGSFAVSDVTLKSMQGKYSRAEDWDKRLKSKKEEIISRLTDKLKKKYKDTNLQAGIRTGNEIMISCDSYFALLGENFVRNEIQEERINKIIQGIFMK